MATATRTRTPATTAEPGTLEYLQRALEDLNQARGHAQQEAQTGIDDAAERIRAAVEDMRRRVREEADELQARLDHASEEVRVELGRAAIRAQRTPVALSELQREIRRAKEAMKEKAMKEEAV